MSESPHRNITDDEAKVRVEAAHLLRRFVNERRASDFDRAAQLLGRDEANDLVNLFRFGADQGGAVRTAKRRNSNYGRLRNSPGVIEAPRSCPCGRTLIQRPRETNKQFRSRRHCDGQCVRTHRDPEVLERVKRHFTEGVSAKGKEAAL